MLRSAGPHETDLRRPGWVLDDPLGMLRACLTAEIPPSRCKALAGRCQLEICEFEAWGSERCRDEFLFDIELQVVILS